MTTTAARVAGRLAPARDADTSDAELVRRFAADRDGAAFAALAARHGPMVFGVCRRVLGDWHLAEDAFQAAFLVLARRAGVISPPGAVAGWLHGVAHRVAHDARRAERRRFLRERPADPFPEPAAVPPDSDADLRAVLDDELRKLPGKYRDLLVACDLEGRARGPVAEALGLPEGTLSSRLTAARRMLAGRLARRGVVPVVVAGVALNGLPLFACEVPRRVLASAARIGLDPSGAVPEAVAALAHGVIRAMTARTVLALAATLLPAVSALGLAASLAADPGTHPTPPEPPRPTPLVLTPVPVVVPVRAEPKPLPKGPNKILIYKSGHLTLIDPDGKNEKRVSENRAEFMPGTGAKLSPDGKRVAFLVQVEKGEDVKPGQDPRRKLYVRELGEKEPGADTKLECQMFVWSPDGTRLVAYEIAGAGDKLPEVTHYLVEATTGEHKSLKLPANHVVTGWSADGDRLLTTSFDGTEEAPRFRLHLMNLDGTEHKALTDGKALVMAGIPSPDGKRLLCQHAHFKVDENGKRKLQKQEVILLDVATGKQTPFEGLPLNGQLQGFCWSPDGKKVAYTWREVHEGTPEELIDKETESFLVVADPDGKNAKTILTEKGRGQGLITLGVPDWR